MDARGEAEAGEEAGENIVQEGIIPPPRSRWTRFIDAVFLGEEDPAALGLCRIALVTVFTLSVLSHVGAVAEYFSDASRLFGSYAREAFPARGSIFFYVTDPWAVRGIFALGVLAHLLWLVGLFTRPAAIVAFGLWASMVGRNPNLYSMPDQCHTALALWLALLPAGRGLSLDARWRGKGGPVPVWCRRLLQLQIAVIYTGTGLLKTGATWRSEGTALYFALVNPYNRHFAVSHLLATIQPYVLRPMTWAVLTWEVGFGGFTLVHWIREATGIRRIPDLRRAFLGFGVLMHLGIQLMLYVAWFTPLMIGAYAAFLRPDEVRRGIAWVARRRRRPVPQSS
ncbi:MAG: HTTM domain-containing protein [Nannocystaceae bacterium]